MGDFIVNLITCEGCGTHASPEGYGQVTLTHFQGHRRGRIEINQHLYCICSPFPVEQHPAILLAPLNAAYRKCPITHLFDLAFPP